MPNCTTCTWHDWEIVPRKGETSSLLEVCDFEQTLYCCWYFQKISRKQIRIQAVPIQLSYPRRQPCRFSTSFSTPAHCQPIKIWCLLSDQSSEVGIWRYDAQQLNPQCWGYAIWSAIWAFGSACEYLWRPKFGIFITGIRCFFLEISTKFTYDMIYVKRYVTYI